MYCTDSILNYEDTATVQFGMQMVSQLKLLGRIDQVEFQDGRRQGTPMKDNPKEPPKTGRVHTTSRKGAMDAESTPHPK